MNLINVNHLTLGYEHQEVIKDLSFTVEKGDFITIIGANGSGKSTLVKGLLGLIKPMQGDIQYHIDTKQIGYMPQKQRLMQHSQQVLKRLFFREHLIVLVIVHSMARRKESWLMIH